MLLMSYYIHLSTARLAILRFLSLCGRKIILAIMQGPCGEGITENVQEYYQRHHSDGRYWKFLVKDPRRSFANHFVRPHRAADRENFS